MAVTIITPQSKFVPRSTAGSFIIGWSCQYPQSAYEILYRKKGISAWSTFGKVTSTATSATINISNFNDFIEYHYRVISYAENKTSGSSVYNGSDTSAAYALMIVPDVQLGTLKVKYGDSMVEVPLYESVQSPDKIKIQNRMTALIDQNLSASTPVRVRENGETKTLAKQPESLGNTGQYAYAYMTKSYSYNYQYYAGYYSYSYLIGYDKRPDAYFYEYKTSYLTYYRYFYYYYYKYYVTVGSVTQNYYAYKQMGSYADFAYWYPYYDTGRYYTYYYYGRYSYRYGQYYRYSYKYAYNTLYK